MIGKRDSQNTSTPAKPTKKVKTETIDSSDSEESDNEISFKHQLKDSLTEDITFEFFPASPHFHDCVGYLLRKNLGFLKCDLTSSIRKICDQTEMGIFVGTSDDAPAETDASASGKADAGPKKPQLAFPEFYKDVPADSTDKPAPKKDPLKDRSVYGFVTILNLTRLGNEALSAKIRSLVLKSCTEDERPRVQSILAKNKDKLGLLVNERVANFPFCMVSDTYEQLLEDKKFMDETEELTAEDKREWDFKYLIYFIPVSVSVQTKAKGESKPKYTIPAKADVDFSKCVFHRPEDRVWASSAEVCRLVTAAGASQVLFALVKYEDFLVKIYSKEVGEV